MHLTRLRLSNFRNHEHTDLGLGEGISVFVGPNGQGKTNVVEAVNFLASGASHRTHNSLALVKQNSPNAVINADFVSGERRLNVDVHIESAGSNKARANGNNIRMRELSRFVHTVIFAPEDLRLIRDDPDERRTFLDGVIEVLSPRMIAVFSDYERVLKQRNSLLKSLRALPKSQRDPGTLDLWDEKLVEIGAEIRVARMSAVSALREPLAHAYRQIAGEDHRTEIALVSKVDDLAEEHAGREDAQRTLSIGLQATRDLDIEKGLSHVGPHRDDVLFSLNSLPTKGYASHGETWSYALALKLAVAELIRTGDLGDPILILDDVFAELDNSRRDRLAAAVQSFEQVLVTAAVVADVPDLGSYKQFNVLAGVVS